MPFAEALESGMARYIGEDTLDRFIEAVAEQSVTADAATGAGAAEGAEDVKVVYTPLNGTGLECVTRILEKTGVRDVTLVEEQAAPDGDFPTCPYPNPEIREALERGLALCEQVEPDLLLATDPDADRVGIAARHGDEYRLISGNEMGVDRKSVV